MIFRGKFSWTFPEGQRAEWEQSFEKKPHWDGEQIVCPSLTSLFPNGFFFPDYKLQMCIVEGLENTER